jgi:uncharacterized protein YdeI (YjbR/CyaY-like superfamily)
VGLPLLYVSKKQHCFNTCFKEYCALLFFKGALLNDADGILIQQTENVQAARQVRFTNIVEIIEMKPILKAYILKPLK